jgi:hypothetical protein
MAAGVDLSGYNTIENARDVKALRRALGFEQLGHFLRLHPRPGITRILALAFAKP